MVIDYIVIENWYNFLPCVIMVEIINVSSELMEKRIGNKASDGKMWSSSFSLFFLCRHGEHMVVNSRRKQNTHTKI